MSVPNDSSRKKTLPGLLIFIAALAALSFGYQKAFYPEPVTPPPPPFDDYSSEAMQQAMQPDAVEAELQSLLKHTNRYPGSQGLENALNEIRNRYEEAGLEVYEQSFRMPAPVTLKSQISTADGTELTGVKLFPFFPNHFQPQSTPEGGLEGTLTLLTDEHLETLPDLSDIVGVIDLSRPPSVHGTRFLQYARMGVKALILTHSDGLEAVQWHTLQNMSTALPIQYVRLAATPSILNALDTKVRLEVQTAYENQTLRNIIGILKAPVETKEAVVINGSVDAVSFLPDLAEGTLRAIPMAAQLKILEGLLPHRDQIKRDVLFTATTGGIMDEAGQTRLLEVIGPAGRPTAVRADLMAELERHQTRLELLDRLKPFLTLPELFTDTEKTLQALNEMDADLKTEVNTQTAHILNTRVFKLSEDRTQAKIRELKAETELNYYLIEKPDDPGIEQARTEYEQASENYRAIKSRYDNAYSKSGMSPSLLLSDYAEEIISVDLGKLLKRRNQTLRKFHEQEIARLSTDLALNEAVSKVVSLQWLQINGVPTISGTEAEQISIGMAGADMYSTHASVVMGLMDEIRQNQEFSPEFRLPPLRGNAGQNALIYSSINAAWPRGDSHWHRFEHPAFLLVHTDRSPSYLHMNDPFSRPWMLELDTMDQLLKMAGETVLSLAYGNGAMPRPGKVDLRTYAGQVLVSGMGQSIIPSYALPDSLVGNRDMGRLQIFSGDPWVKSPMALTDPYGKFMWLNSPARMAIQGQNGYSPMAAYIGDSGLIEYIKDEGSTSQRIYKSIGLSIPGNEAANVSIVLFRGSAVTLLDMINPQTMENFASVDYISQDGLSAFEKQSLFVSSDQLNLMTWFLDPTRRFYVRLRSGAAGNPDALSVRAFMLGTDKEFAQSAGREIEGAGYWPQDYHLLLRAPYKTADSMLFLNGKRLDLQNRYNMADKQTRRFQSQSEALLEQSRDPNIPYPEKVNLARDATTYAILNHPILRESISEAVIGILWYLGLLVPFCFFFEKLVFGFSDIRKQIGAQSVIFLVVFFLLRLLHPAFEMIRSSIMILLGFVILLISAGITALFMSKFQENLDSLRKQQGRVKAAEVNTAGAVGMAFMLGLNNMHRRKVRTGLTCGTLVLMTFVMISFTSSQSNIVEQNSAVGKADYQGILFKDSELRNISDAEQNALQAKFGSKFILAPRTFYVGAKDWLGVTTNPEVELQYASETSKRSVEVQSMLEMTPQEPLADSIQMVSDTEWFAPDGPGAKVRREVLLPMPVAEALRIRPEELTATNLPVVSVNGVNHTVKGIFDPASLQRLTDLDGDGLLPFDVEAMADAVIEENRVLSPPGAPRFNADQVVIVLRTRQPLTVMAGSIASDRRDFSLALVMPDLNYREARDVIEQTMEQTGKELYYGLDGVAYVGKRSRESTVTGMIDMLIPLIIAALTVLNTMKGSVYERRDEIYVYNAVGIAPKYIFFMFIAEAFVYAVVGSVLGYILSQGTGRILTALDMTGGLNMTYTSLTTIYASLTIAASVFISTIFPARSAVKIASPAEDSGWALPEPDGDTLRFNLPFTFTHSDRIAVLSFFHRYFLNHAEGSSGPFFCAEPSVDISDERDPLNDNGPIPRIRVQAWLKPFDLGVSQNLTIELPIDEETGEYISRITLTRESGTHEAWLRLNHFFVILVRRHFLHWRAVSEAERKEMLEEARSLFQTAQTQEQERSKT